MEKAVREYQEAVNEWLRVALRVMDHLNEKRF